MHGKAGYEDQPFSVRMIGDYSPVRALREERSVATVFVDDISFGGDMFHATRECPKCKRPIEKSEPDKQVTCPCGWDWR